MARRRFLIGFLALVVLALAPVPAAALPATSLAGYWSLDSVLTDGSGNGNTGTWYGAPLGATVPDWSTSHKAPLTGNGASLRFDGIDDHVVIPHSSSLNIGGSTGITISAWVYLHSLPSASEVMMLVNKTGAYSLQVTAGGKVKAYLGPLTAAVITPETVLSIDAWHHIVVTYNGSQVRIYVDRVIRTNVPMTGAQATSTNKLVLGRRDPLPATEGQGHLHGYLDEVRIYNRALTNAEIGATGGGTEPPQPPQPPVDPVAPTGEVRFGPPVSLSHFVVKSGAALPLKFTVGGKGRHLDARGVSLSLYNSTGHKLVTYALGHGRDVLRYAPGNGQFMVNIHLRELGLSDGRYTAKVHYGTEVLGQITFSVVDERGPAANNGKAHGKK